jgi:hypothetical protein
VTRTRRPRIIAASALIAGAAIVGGLGISGVATDLSSTPSTSDAPKSSLDGVYTYKTSGSESVGAATHAYPAKTTITLVQADCGVRLQWEPSPQRSTTWTLCLANGKVTVRGVTEARVVSGRTETIAYTCTQRASFTCTAPNGSASGRIVGGGETAVAVGAAGVAALQVEAIMTVAGRSAGTETTDWWLALRTLLPLRVIIDNRTSAAGVHVHENAMLQLLSTRPR